MLAKKKEGTVLYPSRDMPRLKFVMGAFRRGARVNKRAHPFVFFFLFRFLCVCFFSVLLSLLCRVSRLSTRPGACVFFLLDHGRDCGIAAATGSLFAHVPTTALYGETCVRNVLLFAFAVQRFAVFVSYQQDSRFV